ncbi:hypothetical protein DFP72DRAFT_852628 [Ephemerocybe angulata]|uniref:Uncharacterized protein n=1 Tax=Ephemerocybe angulata TaxID=980116 RepID=A0A8H6HN11_9AGAR|nr:hypothetical protein DFP72DRAFT_852628 [Tulosesus angulatus]
MDAAVTCLPTLRQESIELRAAHVQTSTCAPTHACNCQNVTQNGSSSRPQTQPSCAAPAGGDAAARRVQSEDSTAPEIVQGEDQEDYEDMPPLAECHPMTPTDIAVSAYLRWWRTKDAFFLKASRMIQQQYGAVPEGSLTGDCPLLPRVRPAYVAVTAYRRWWETKDDIYASLMLLAEQAEKPAETQGRVFTKVDYDAYVRMRTLILGQTHMEVAQGRD